MSDVICQKNENLSSPNFHWWFVSHRVNDAPLLDTLSEISTESVTVLPREVFKELSTYLIRSLADTTRIDPKYFLPL